MNDELMLVEPSEEYFAELAAYRNDFLENSDSMDGCGPLRRFDDMKAYLEDTMRYTREETLPEGMVLATQFLCIRKSDNRLVGMIQVRHYLNDFLRTLGGHIGYSVRPSERRKGYASWMLKNVQPKAHGILFHPDLIRGTALGQEIKNYSFFSYATREALHLSEEERATVMDCLHKIEAELKHSIDKHSRRLICANIGLLLDYCMRFYERQFTTREEVNKDIVVRFERLLDEYFDSDALVREGLPTVRYFADKVFLSANYFGDMIRKQTGQTASEYIQNKLIGRAKEALLGTDKTTSEIAYALGFQYPQHLSRMFKRVTGCTPNEFRAQR